MDMRKAFSIPDRATLVRAGALFVTYVFLAHVGRILFVDVGASPWLIWFPAGIAMAATVVWGYRMVWPVFFASFVFNASVGVFSVAVIGIVAAGAALQALVGAYILHRFSFEPTLLHTRDVLLLIVVSCGVTVIAPAFLFFSLALESGIATPLTWESRWVSEMVSIFVIMPLTTFALSRPIALKRKDIIETAAVFFFAVVIAFVVFWVEPRQIYTMPLPLIYLLLVPLTWVALRMDAARMVIMMFLIAVIALTGTHFGFVDHAPETAARRTGNIMYMVLFLSGIYYFLAVVADERRRALRDMKKYLTHLEEALAYIRSVDEAKSEFLSMLAHELRNPLAAASSYTELISYPETGPEEREQYLKVIRDSFTSMARLLNDLSDISRISRRQVELRREAVVMQGVIERSVQSVDADAKAKDHTIDISAPEEPLCVDGDPVRLKQIIVNLLDNAIKYTDDGGAIAISCRKEGESVIVDVRDNGEGIANDMRDKIFELFIRAQHSSHRRGLGIGLSLVKRLVDLHGGTISVHSEGPGMGSVFTVTLPEA